MIKDSSLKKIKKYKKYEDLYDKNSLECKSAIFGATILCIIMYNLPNIMDIDNINKVFDVLTKDIAMALIGLLGFTVSGLAILTGVISKKEVDRISEANKIDKLESILISFYLLGLTIAFAIVGHIVIFIFSLSNLKYDMRVVMLLTFIFSYLDIFIIFYAVKLIGNCLEIFFIVNEVTEKEQHDMKKIKNIYNSYRLTALETVLLKKVNMEELNSYMNVIKEQINENEKYSDELEKMYKEHFSIKD